MANKIVTAPTSNDVIATINQIIDDKQDTLVSGTNIKTINNNSLLGSGNIEIDNVFIATYNDTTYTEILGAFQQNKSIFVRYDNDGFEFLIPLVAVDEANSTAFFSMVSESNLLIISVESPDLWGTNNAQIGTVKSVNSTQPDNNGNVALIPPIGYGTSTTAASTTEKVVSIPEITTLNSGQIIVVSPTKTASVANLTIKLNNFTAYPILYAGDAITTSTDSIVWNANQPSAFIFNGTNWLFLCHGRDSNTTYSTMSVAEGVTGTATSNRSLQAVNLKQIIQGTTLTGLDTTTNTTVVATDDITTGIGKLQAQIDNKADDSAVVKKDGGSTTQTISLSSGTGTTPLGIKSRATTSSYISFTSSTTWLGSIGVNSSKKPVFYNGTGYTLATTSDIPTIATSVSSSSTNAQTVGAKLFYDTVGDIESALNTINSGSNS